MATASSSAVGKLSREEFRRQKDLDAARKAGTAPAAVDEEGKSINPHIPQYISQAPWYLDTGIPTLSHQRKPKAGESSASIDSWYDRGKTAGPAATKYRKGACENCGAMTHKKQDCLERPRKKGAKFTNKNIAADEIVQDIEMGYDAKRDRWNGYDPSEHKKVYEEYAALEAARQKLREEQIDNQTTTDMSVVKKVAKAGKEKKEGDGDEFGSSDDEGEDEDKYADAADAVGQKLDTKTRITVRNLRIREDTAKYLINLDPDSAYYDPKTRSMRDAPDKSVRPEDAVFAGENFVRNSGESQDMQRLQLYAWQSAARGNDVHLNANPTQGEILHRQFQDKKEKLKDTTKSSILAKYGGEQYLEKAPKELLQGQTEQYVEYSRTGQVIKGLEPVKVKSKYDEDVYLGNHTSVWGSWYSKATGQWGFACCHSTISKSYCTGQAGIEAAAASSTANMLKAPHASSSQSSLPREEQQSLVEQHLEKQARGETASSGEQRFDHSGKRRLGESDGLQLDQDKLRRAIQEEKKRKTGKKEEWEEERDERNKKRKVGAMGDSGFDVTEEEMEAYRLNKPNFEDPMANYVDSEDV
ncbi:mRNA splicing protein [Tulasnella sp. UAMH 9824]|nr:mRNA splicing protein [Tulasnella sp. UAMH 9824]